MCRRNRLSIRILTNRTVLAVTPNSRPTSAADCPSTATRQKNFQSRSLTSARTCSITASNCVLCGEGFAASDVSLLIGACSLSLARYASICWLSEPPAAKSGVLPCLRKWSRILLSVIRRSQPRNVSPGRSRWKSPNFLATACSASCTVLLASAG